jgi:hypothetical protein
MIVALNVPVYVVSGGSRSFNNWSCDTTGWCDATYVKNLSEFDWKRHEADSTEICDTVKIITFLAAHQIMKFSTALLSSLAAIGSVHAYTDDVSEGGVEFDQRCHTPNSSNASRATVSLCYPERAVVRVIKIEYDRGPSTLNRHALVTP